LLNLGEDNSGEGGDRRRRRRRTKKSQKVDRSLSYETICLINYFF